MARMPTNSDILQELNGMNARITALETWKIAEDAARKAVLEYKQTEFQEKEQQSIMDILKGLAPFLVALTALAYSLIRVIK